MRLVVPRSSLLFIAFVIAVAATALPSCGAGTGLFRQYEYEEEMYLSLDGSATLYVNSSIAALNALHGTTFDAAPSARFDRDDFRRYFSSPVMHVTRVSSSRRSGRRFVHVRMSVDDVRRLGEAPPFAWSTYKFWRDGDQLRFEQVVGLAADDDPADAAVARWNGSEIVAFRLHLPSKITYHNTHREIGRGNILVWEQSLTERLHGAPLALEVHMQTQSILYRTLWLFGLTFLVVAVFFVALLWWVVRRGRKQPPHWAQKTG